MKILIVSVGKMSGGIESYTIQLGQGLSRTGCEVYYALRQDGWLSENIKGSNVLLVNMNKSAIWTSMKEIRDYVIYRNINIIHCNSNNALFLCLLIRETLTRKKIGIIHGDVLVDQANKGSLFANGYKYLEKIILKSCCNCVTVSNSLKNILISRGVPERNIRVIHIGIELFEYAILPNYKDTTVKICSVGNLLPVKNQMQLLMALVELKRIYPEVHFKCDIYGEGRERRNLEKYISENDLREVSLFGFEENVRQVLNDYQLYIHPSKYESFGMAVIEAMNAGCCVIVNNVGGMVEIVNHNSGFVVDFSNMSEIVESIHSVYVDRNRMEQMGINGKNHCIKEFSVDKMVEKTCLLYKEILGENYENNIKNKDKL